MSGISQVQRIDNIRKVLRSSQFRRLISTSKKNASETVTAESAAESVVKKEKNWVHFGFDRRDKTADRNALHSAFFASVTLCLVGGTFFYSYVPDVNLRDWAQREAFLEIRRREAANLPYVDPNVISPSQIHLPTDEELGDTEIII